MTEAAWIFVLGFVGSVDRSVDRLVDRRPFG